MLNSGAPLLSVSLTLSAEVSAKKSTVSKESIFTEIWNIKQNGGFPSAGSSRSKFH